MAIISQGGSQCANAFVNVDVIDQMMMPERIGCVMRAIFVLFWKTNVDEKKCLLSLDTSSLSLSFTEPQRESTSIFKEIITVNILFKKEYTVTNSSYRPLIINSRCFQSEANHISLFCKEIFAVKAMVFKISL